MTYNRRDVLGHWVDRNQQILRPCHHACCRGYRAHPHNLPIVPLARDLRRVSDEQLAARYDRVTREENDPKARRAELQIIAEFERRDKAEAKTRARAAEQRRRWEAAQARKLAKRTDQEIETERIRVAAEQATRGNLVNAKGRARGIHPDEVLRGREEVFQRYASDEAREYFAVQHRPTAAYFRGRDTRVADRATEPKRRKRGVVDRSRSIRAGR